MENESKIGTENDARKDQSQNEKRAIPNPLAFYADLGFRVFPNHYKTVAGCSCKQGQLCEKAGKHPAIKGYQHLASSNFEVITTSRDLFGGKFRNFDIGALAGFGWFVLDSDDGEVGDLPKTWKSKSANRGFHYFFRVPQGTTIRNIHKVIPGADIKGRGGLVVLPSEVNNREWVNAPHETELVDCPEWLLEAIQNHERIRSEFQPEVFGHFDFASEAIEEGARNETLFRRYACYLRSLSFDYAAIFSQLTAINETKCDPPLDVDELEDIARSACEYPLDDALTNILTRFREALGSIPWKGKGGKSDRSILVTLLTQNQERYEVVPEGLEVSISYRKIAERTGITKKSVYTRIKEAPYLRKGKPSQGRKSGTIVILHSLLECVSTTTLIPKGGGGMASVVVATHSLLFNSMRWGNLGKSAVLILQILLVEAPLRRKDLEERLGYSQGGASGILKKLKDAGLIQSAGGVYSLVEDFEEKIQPFLEENNEDIERMKKVHEDDGKDYDIRLEAWRMAYEDGVEAEIQRTAMDSQGVYCVLTMKPEAVYNRLRLRMEHHYRQLKFGQESRECDGLGKGQDCA